MTLLDAYDGRSYSMLNLFNDWKSFRAEDPVNHSARFPVEFFEILMASVNGRNDLDVVGLTPAETSRYILRLRSHLKGDI
jgi:hypothetical protein